MARGTGGGGLLRAIVLTALGLAVSAPAAARVLLSVEEALELAFPGCEVERRTVFLTEAELARARELSGEAVESALVHPYEARCAGEAGGTAYFDSHVVRTLPETLMVVVDPEGRVRRLEVLTFAEPPEYLPREAWYEQFLGQPLSEDLAIRRRIRAVAGATLTARATAEAVRRVLAIHQALSARASSEGRRP
jgi:hypothetical protein